MTALVRRISLLLVLAAVLAAGEVVSAAWRAPWRAAGLAFFAQAFVIWVVFGLLASVPSALTLRLLGKRAPPVAVVFLGWLALPVALHTTLDQFVGPEAALGLLSTPAPWIWASLVLAFGFAALWAAARLVARVSERWLALVLLPVALLVGLVWPALSGRETRSGSSAADGPNLLLLVWDTTRADKLEPYGHERETTPHLARFAERAIVFENATAAATFTFTSHLSMLSGVYPSTHGARLLSPRYDPRRAQLVSHVLHRAGYRTGAFVGTDVLAGRTGLRYGFEVYDDRVDPPVCDTHAWRLVHDLQAVAARCVPALSVNGNPHWFQDFQRPGAEVLARALDWIREDDPRPWFCFVNLYDVHWPYLPQADGLALVNEYRGPMDGYLFRSDAWQPGYRPTDEDKRHLAELYEGELLELDAEVARFLEALGLERGDTAVVMTSDHGEAFGEGDRWKHEDVGEPELRVPLILWSPEHSGARVTSRASGIDVAPTLLELAGLPYPAEVEGSSLVSEPLEELPGARLGPVVDEPLKSGLIPHERDPGGDGPTALEGRLVFVEDRDHMDPRDVRIVLYRGHWKLVRRGLDEDARYTLFDLASDPLGEHDVAGRNADVLEELRDLLEEHRRRRDAADAEMPELVPESLDGLQQLGYTGD